MSFQTVPNDGGGNRSGARSLLLVSLTRFYSQPGNMQAILPYIEGAHEGRPEGQGVSLRLIDWFVTNYSKKYNVVLMSPNAKDLASQQHFNVYLSYRSQLKAYSKQQFDPFRRRDRILFCYRTGCSVETTVGQLNFFRWMLQNRLLDYVERNLDSIENDMASAAGKDNKGKKQLQSKKKNADLNKNVHVHEKERRVRSELSSCSAARSMTRVSGALTVAFQ